MIALSVPFASLYSQIKSKRFIKCGTFRFPSNFGFSDDFSPVRVPVKLLISQAYTCNANIIIKLHDFHYRLLLEKLFNLMASINYQIK